MGYNSKGEYQEPDNSLLHATKENAFGNHGGRVGLADLPWVRRTVLHPDGRSNDGCSYGSFYHAIAENDPFHWISTPVNVFGPEYLVSPTSKRRRVV